MPKFWHMSYKLIGKYFSVFLFFLLVFVCFQDITYVQNNVIETKTKGFSLNKRTVKKAARKVNVFCMLYLSKKKNE